MTDSDPIETAGAAEARPRSARFPVREAWIWIGLALVFAGRILSGGRSGGKLNVLVVALFLVPYAILAYAAYKVDASGTPLMRALRATLFAFLVIEAFYFGVSLGGLAAAVGAYLIYTRFIRPRVPTTPAESEHEDLSR